MTSPALHPLALLSDSALPLGSFAFSSGLESFLAHSGQHASSAAPSAASPAAFPLFLSLSLTATARAALPYMLAASRRPRTILRLLNDLDASTTCSVARRASEAQGRALVGLWERCWRATPSASCDAAAAALDEVSAALQSAPASNAAVPWPPVPHYAPLFALAARALGLGLHTALYLFLLAHARAVLSAAVRAGALGPYQMQAVLAARGLRDRIEALVREALHRSRTALEADEELAAVSVPLLEIWGGRHELLYSRIFNS